ncbi:MAG: replicative DNA helicase [Clostridiales bacterium]|nr:replicative DNA helicase [Clostridiales bacterium]
MENMDNLIEEYTNDIDVEMALLSLCMRKNNAILEASWNKITSDDFTDNRNKLIFMVVMDMFFANAQIDRFTVMSELERRNLADKAGGQRYVYRIGDMTAVSSALDGYIEAIKERSTIHKIVSAADEIKRAALKGNRRSDEVLDRAISELTKIRPEGNTAGLEKLSSSLKTTMTRIMAELNDENAGRKIKVGFPKLDSMLGGLRPGSLNILAARPAMGKSALAVNMAVNVAANNKTVAIFSVEMSKDEINTRLLSSAMNKPLNEILSSKKLSDADKMQIDNALMKLSEYPIYLDDSSNTTPDSIKTSIQQLISSGNPPRLIIVDYLQLIHLKEMSGRSRYEEVTAISNQLKRLAKELKVPIIALAQVSRDTAKRNDHTPQLADLKDSGAIEQDADTVMFVDRPDYYGENNNGNTPSMPEQEQKKIDINEAMPAFIYLSKNRHGATGKDSVWWIPSKTLFYEPDPKDPKEPESITKNDESEDADEPEAPKTEEEEMEEAFMADQHDDFPEGFLEE